MQKILFIIFSLLLIPFANAELVINEIMYNPSGADGGHEWIEFFNSGFDDINLDGYSFFENN